MEGTPKAIEIKGIVRNATVIGVQDGQAEDLINMRFMDGSWRASGDGRLIDFTMGREYTQLYIHTNVYRHLLGVYDGKLYWFADIADDGFTFTPLSTPVALATVVGNIWITQTGHLLTIIDENDDFEHLVFKTGEDAYVEVNVDVNGKATDRSMYPYGQVHFNLYEPFELPTTDLSKKSHSYSFEFGESSESTEYSVRRNKIITAFNKVQEKNLFTRPFFICAAIKLYDGSYAFASNPVLLYPRETALRRYYDANSGADIDIDSDKRVIKLYGGQDDTSVYFVGQFSHYYPTYDTFDQGRKLLYQLYTVETEGNSNTLIKHISRFPGTMSGAQVGYVKESWFPVITQLNAKEGDTNSSMGIMILGSDIVCSIDNSYRDLIIQNPDIFASFCIFITPEIDEYDLSTNFNNKESAYVRDTYPLFDMTRNREDVIYDLTHAGFYLLKEYEKDSIVEILQNPIVDLSGKENELILKNIIQQKRLTTEAITRTTYLPKVSYMYNGRLHIANYKAYPFFGYPIDLFHLHNHSVKVQEGAWFPADQDGQRVLPNLADNNDDYLQYEKSQKNITYYDDLVEAGAPYFLVKVYIDSSQGEQVVCRYIPAYNPSPAVNGRADFIEDLNPLLTYPDARAKKMEIYYVYRDNLVYKIRMKEFLLTPHPYLNIAYYIDEELKPISLSSFPVWKTINDFISNPDDPVVPPFDPNDPPIIM